MFSLVAAVLLSFAVSGCAQSQLGTSAAASDATFICPSGDCQGVNGGGNMGGNSQF